MFTLRPVDSPGWKKKLAGHKVELQLYCQAPGCWHPTDDGGKYTILLRPVWLLLIGPYVGALVKVLKYAAPIVAPATGVRLPDLQAEFEQNFKLMEELVKKLPDYESAAGLRLMERIPEDPDPEKALGPALRALRSLLDDADPVQHWGGLRKVLTPEGHYLWLCDHHAEEYRL